MAPAHRKEPMPEDQAPPTEDTPTPDPGTPDPEPAAPEAEGTPDDAPDYEKRYADLQPEYTRATQENAQLRQIIDLARQGDPEALEFLGYDPPADTEDEDAEEQTLEEKYAALEKRLNEREQTESEQREEQELQEAADRFYKAELEKLDPDENWSDQYRALVVRVGDDHLADDGLPDLAAAHKAIQAQFEEDFKARVESKRKPQAPSGANPNQEPDLNDKEARREYMAQRYAEMEQPSL